MSNWTNPELKLEFPAHFPIKVVGAAHDEFEIQIIAIALRHDPEFLPENLKRNQSKSGKYQSVTLPITAISREQLDAIYTDLKACEHVMWAL
ncbi:YbeD family protein [Thiolinea disciformis]|uniref:YbeD family protein n=1 Tax=Thiolinea disciformis TaxID=125614 RepID=UPI000380696A|nr:DUF493 domain-containing protein [Thiolinea disciformis]